MAPDTPQRAALESLSDSCLMKSETGRRPRPLHLCAAGTGNDITSTLLAGDSAVSDAKTAAKV